MNDALFKLRASTIKCRITGTNDDDLAVVMVNDLVVVVVAAATRIVEKVVRAIAATPTTTTMTMTMTTMTLRSLNLFFRGSLVGVPMNIGGCDGCCRGLRLDLDLDLATQFNNTPGAATIFSSLLLVMVQLVDTPGG